MSRLREAVLEAIAALVAIPSDATEHRAQSELALRLRALRFDVELQEVEPDRSNLVATRGRGGTFFCSHADVHPPHGHPDPWTARLEGDELVGRGVLDAKGQIAALLAALEAEPDSPATVVVTCAEETTGAGSRDLRLPDKPSSGVVLEPTGFAVCTAQSGVIDIELRCRAAGGHAWAHPPPASALDVLQRAFDALDGCSFMTARHPLLPPPRRHVGTVVSGEHLWRTPASAVARVGLGLVPGVDPEAAREEAEAALGSLEGVAWEVLDTSEPIEVPGDLPVVHRLGAELPRGGMSSWTDAGNLWVHHGIPCVVFGAGDLSSAHSDRESVRVSDLVRLAEILGRALKGEGD